MASDRVGFIGVGNMGRAMATPLLEAGIKLTVCDPNPANTALLRERGAHVANNAREVADEAELVIACLPSLKASQEVALGENGVVHGKAIRIYVEMSTIGSAMIEQIAEALRARHIALLDAPVSAPSGGASGVKDGTLAIMMAGEKVAYDRARPVLTLITSHIFYLGDKPGMGQIAKVINNHISRAAKVATYEGMALGVKAGLDAKTLIDVINASSGKNATTMEKFPQKILPRRYSKNSSLNNTFKDHEEFMEEAKKLDAPLWLAPHVMRLFEEAARDGYFNCETYEVYEYVEKMAGVAGKRASIEITAPPRKE